MSPSHSRHASPELPDDLIANIVLRLPPDDPARLVCSSLVCKAWRRVLTDPAFLRRYREVHRAPPMLGFFHSEFASFVSTFFPIAASSPPFADRRNWYPLDSRHGLALFHTSRSMGDLPTGLIVWDPVTDVQHGVPLPQYPVADGPWGVLRSDRKSWNAVVLCAADGCDHLDCHGGPFLVVFVGTYREGLTHACVYSSETGAWSDMATVQHPVAIVNMWPSSLVGDAVYFPCGLGARIVECDLSKRKLSVIDPPFEYHGGAVLMTAEDGALGFAVGDESSIYLWSREVDANGAVAWVQRIVIEFKTLLLPRALLTTPIVIGFAGEAGVIFLKADDCIITIELKSGQVREVPDRGFCRGCVFPYASFYTPDDACGILPPPIRMQ